MHRNRALIAALLLVVPGLVWAQPAPVPPVIVVQNESDVIHAGSGSASYTPSGVICVSTTTAQTGANTNETDLWTCTLPANTLAVNGAGVRITLFGSFGANGNLKTRRVSFGSTVMMAIVSTANNESWRVMVDLIRVSATAQIAHVLDARGTVGTFALPISTPAETLGGPVVIKITGQNGTANAGDIVFRGAIVEYLPAPQ